MTLVKICGITNLEDALAAVELGADALGFNFYKKSSRTVDPDLVQEILQEIPRAVWRVGVFVNEPEQYVVDICHQLELDYLQFHGDETPYYCEQFATPYWKAFRLNDEKSLQLMKKYRGDYYLIDAAVEGAYGGTGMTGNWDLAREAKKMGKIILAGGLTPENVELAIRTVKPDGVDVASGVELSPGRKDHHKLEKFIANVKEM
ncbi:MAG: phosphoribosylanthranilate isomerase [Deltaproteobacteria bacterium]|nr:phosphoribosylanthranilate isomerase [Deltaproteobacteria bacterium]